MKLIVHIDLNAFFAQVEELKDPTLVGHPVGVGGKSSRSVLSTANYVARSFGLHSGMPTSEARKLCPQLRVIDGHYHEYAAYSDRFMSFLRQRYHKLEQTSVDECYIDVTGLCPPEREAAHEYLRDLQLDLFKFTNLKCSIGLGSNRFLAKMGSDYHKPLGLTIILKDDVSAMLWPLPIEKMYGIGRKTYPRLEALGIATIGDLAQTADPEVKRLLGNTFLYHQAHANGDGRSEVSTASFDPKSISSARTFEADTGEYEELKAMIVKLAGNVAAELRRYRKTANTVVITFRDGSFSTTSKRLKFPTYSNQSPELISRALQVFDRYYNGVPLRLIGVGVAEICGVEELDVQLSLAAVAESGKDEGFDAVLKQLQKKGKLIRASELKPKKSQSRRGSRFHAPED